MTNSSNARRSCCGVSMRLVRRGLGILFLLALAISLGFNWLQYQQQQEYFAVEQPPHERFHSGDRETADRILLLRVRGTIMPPFTERIRRSIKRAAEDDRVKGILLSIDSPGGLVADSHQIYNDLVAVRATKPIFVSMRRMAASGGYYIAMGAGPDGRIFAEPTTWTGSIGVIIPRFDLSTLASEHGIASDPLKTGKFKDTLNPFRAMTDDERQLWAEILADSFTRFQTVIADNRAELSLEQVGEYATGQIFTARQALERNLIDEIAFEDEALEQLREHVGLTSARVVTYEFVPSWYEILASYVSASSRDSVWDQVLEASVPRALYYCSWAPLVPGDNRQP